MSSPVDNPSGCRSRGCLLSLVAATVLVFLLLIVPNIRNIRPAVERSQCRKNLEKIGLGLRAYHDQYGSFPPAFTQDASGRRLQSWRTLILPFLAHQLLYDSIDLNKPWNDPVNAKARRALISEYTCPTLSRDSPKTSYLGIATRDGAFAPGKVRTQAEIGSAPECVVQVIEVPQSRAVEWMCPMDADEPVLDPLLRGHAGPHEGYFYALFANGGVGIAWDGSSIKEQDARFAVNPSSVDTEEKRSDDMILLNIRNRIPVIPHQSGDSK